MARVVNLDVDQGTNFSVTLTAVHANGASMNLTNYTANAQFRKHSGANTATTLTVVTTNSGVVTLSSTPGQTSNISSGRYVYDVTVTSNTGVITRVFEGNLFLNPMVTR